MVLSYSKSIILSSQTALHILDRATRRNTFSQLYKYLDTNSIKQLHLGRFGLDHIRRRSVAQLLQRIEV